jgi:hypothetical protein
MAKRINEMEAKFIAFYLADPKRNATQCAISAGYSKHSAPQIGNQLLRKPKIKNAIELHIASKREAVTKDDYIDMALKDYQSLELTEANKPRFLDIAGKALGYIGNNQDSKVTNQTLVINVDTSSMKRDDLIANVRRLLADNSHP